LVEKKTTKAPDINIDNIKMADWYIK
jgi:hypothetical protein